VKDIKKIQWKEVTEYYNKQRKVPNYFLFLFLSFYSFQLTQLSFFRYQEPNDWLKRL
jgi:hypothetical protein